MLSALQVLDQLPQVLAVAVVAASSGDLNRKLCNLPPSLHHLAVEATFPSIHHSLTFSFEPNVRASRRAAYAVLQAAITPGRPLKTLKLSHIPVQCPERLHNLISAVCMSASDVSLSFDDYNVMPTHQGNALAQIGEALSRSKELTSLSLAFMSNPSRTFNFNRLLQASTGLQSLSIERIADSDSRSHSVPVPKGITNLLCLTHLCVGLGFHAMDLQQLVCRMMQLQALHLRGGWEPRATELPSLSLLTCMQTLELQDRRQLQIIQPLDGLTALQILHLSKCKKLQRLPSLSSLTALWKLHLSECGLTQIPPLDTVTALQTLNIRSCLKLQILPVLDSLAVLQTLELTDCELQRIPSLYSLTALQTLQVSSCKHLREIPLLDSLAALQTLELSHLGLQRIPPLASLTALKTLKLTNNTNFLELPPMSSLTALQTLDLYACSQLQRIPPLDSLTDLQKLDVRCCSRRLELPLLCSLPVLEILESSSPPPADWRDFAYLDRFPYDSDGELLEDFLNFKPCDA
jgi:Leucine-rich repeat (LRR) protein